jgi:hypothetical protein
MTTCGQTEEKKSGTCCKPDEGREVLRRFGKLAAVVFPGTFSAPKRIPGEGSGIGLKPPRVNWILIGLRASSCGENFQPEGGIGYCDNRVFLSACCFLPGAEPVLDPAWSQRPGRSRPERA